nr:hypothetical protein [Tanacetum cinerariifolium]
MRLPKVHTKFLSNHAPNDLAPHKRCPFVFPEECILAFDKLKQELTHAPMMIKPDWSLPFKFMCDASDYAVRAVRGQRKDKHFQPIHYASKTRADNISARDETPQKYIQINKLDELRLNAYESSISYKERVKRWHDKRIKTPTKYEKGNKVLLFNSRLRLFLGKLKSRWYGPFAVSKDMKNRAIKLYDEDGKEFIVNKQHLKPYQKDALDFDGNDDVTLEDEGGVT